MTWTFRATGSRETMRSARSDSPCGELSGCLSSSVSRRWRILCGVLLLTTVVASRLPLAPRHLITFDEINFALAIERFDPGTHQPQPPGYPLFVRQARRIGFETVNCWAKM